MNINVIENDDDILCFRAFIECYPEIYGLGKTAREAIGDLILCTTGTFGVQKVSIPQGVLE
jgi:hypothetical protein